MKTITWTQYNESKQDTYLDSENLADMELVADTKDLKVYAHKSLHVQGEDYFFSGHDEDFALVISREKEYLAYDCTLEDILQSEKKTYMLAVENNGQQKYVVTENDIDLGGWVDADPEDFGFSSKEEAEKTREELVAYAKSIGWANPSILIEEHNVETYDVVFHDDTSDNAKGWKETYEKCLNYIRTFNGTDESYFADYKGGMVAILCNETGDEVYEEEIPNGKECWEDMFIEEKERNLREIMETYQTSEYKSAADMAYNIRVGYENDPEWFNFEVKNLDRFESVVADMIADEFDNEAEA